MIDNNDLALDFFNPSIEDDFNVDDLPVRKLPKIAVKADEVKRHLEAMGNKVFTLFTKNPYPKGYGPFTSISDVLDALAEISEKTTVWVNVSEPRQSDWANHNCGKYSDSHYDAYSNLFIDIDPSDKANPPAESVRDAALSEVLTYLDSIGIVPAMTGSSGNGRAVVLRASLPNRKQSKGLEALLDNFSNLMHDKIKHLGMQIDSSVFDESRIIGLCGTVNFGHGRATPRYVITTNAAPTIVSETLLASLPLILPPKAAIVSKPSEAAPSASLKAVDGLWNKEGYQYKLLFTEFGNFFTDKDALRKILEAGGWNILGEARKHEGWQVSSRQNESTTPVQSSDLEVYLGLGCKFLHSHDKPWEWDGVEDYIVKYLPHIGDKIKEVDLQLIKKRNIDYDAKTLTNWNIDSHIQTIMIKEDWLCPQILALRNEFFREYEANIRKIEPSKRLLMTMYYLYQSACKALIGKRLYYNPIDSELLYCGSDCVIIVQDSGDGKSNPFKKMHKFYETFALKGYKIGLNSTFSSFLSEARSRYSPNIIIKNKSTIPHESKIESDCLSNLNCIFTHGDEVAEKLAKLSGAWSQGTQTSTGSMLELLEGKAEQCIEASSKASGKEMLFDPSCILVGATNLGDLEEHFPLFDEKNKGKGMAARFLPVFDGPGVYDYDAVDISNGEILSTLSKMKSIANTQKTYKCIFSFESRQIPDTLSFQDISDQKVFERFKKDEPKHWKSIQDKILTRAISDSMLWAFLSNEVISPLENGWVLSKTEYRDQVCQGIIDCSKYLEKCYKTRVAMYINAFYFMSFNLAHDYQKKILQVLMKATEPVMRNVLLRSVYKNDWRSRDLVADALDKLVSRNLVLESKIKSSGGRPPTVYSLNNETNQL